MDGIELVVLDNWLAVLGKSIFNQIEKKKNWLPSRLLFSWLMLYFRIYLSHYKNLYWVMLFLWFWFAVFSSVDNFCVYLQITWRFKTLMYYEKNHLWTNTTSRLYLLPCVPITYELFHITYKTFCSKTDCNCLFSPKWEL